MQGISRGAGRKIAHGIRLPSIGAREPFHIWRFWVGDGHAKAPREEQDAILRHVASWGDRGSPMVPPIANAGNCSNLCHRTEGTGGSRERKSRRSSRAYIVQQMATTNAAFGNFQARREAQPVDDRDCQSRHRYGSAGCLGILFIAQAEAKSQCCRNRYSQFVAYVPKGSIRKSEVLAKTAGSGTTTPREPAMGRSDLRGVDAVPGIAERSPSYLVRQIYDPATYPRRKRKRACGVSRRKTLA
jgi:hypothetical protein